MLSEEQQIERLIKIRNIIEVLIDSKNINEISKKTKIPTSTIQRYLNNHELLKGIGFSDEDIGRINIWLQNARTEGLSRGGKTSQARYKDNYSRLSDGKFSGRKK